MARDGNGHDALPKKVASSEKDEAPSKKDSAKAPENSDVDSETKRKHSSSRRKARKISDSDGEKAQRRKKKSRRRYSSESDSDSGSGSGSEDDESERTGSDSECSESVSESEEERKERKRKERRRRREREEERYRRRKEKERKKRKKEKEEERRKKEKRKKKKKEKEDRGKKGAVTNSWGKYGVIRETDMWNKRPEFTAWLAEVKQVNLENLSNWEEKQMFKEFMEDHNTTTFPSKKYYNLDAYYRRQMEKEMKKGFKKVLATERTVFNDEEQRRLELLQAREKHKEEQVMALKHSMESGMAQAMKEQAQLREEMAYQYKLGNFEAAAAIQRRLDPDAAI
ncbi:vicilin-like seed storage protein At2g18540 [Gastrolobium bilobum]|uniref:vicilin-like seed storage protein At2g18540 n=1 Tax=Gastrolobium bilobum TaxID=150636 RepID=UPI002AB0EBB5|nr:vicilin-like seed storage protein At2g18540 [Gastrolobium bilobum]